MRSEFYTKNTNVLGIQVSLSLVLVRNE